MPKWIKPQLTRLVDEAPAGSGWLHEIKYDGYRMHARIDGGKAALLTRTGLDWSHRYRRTIEALGFAEGAVGLSRWRAMRTQRRRRACVQSVTGGDG
jgi:ATP-dependent DNA ligase